MNKLGIHESELNTIIKEKRCWHPAHSHHTFSERVLQWGSACTPLGRALPPHGLQLPSLGGHADTPDIPEGKRDGVTQPQAPPRLSRTDTQERICIRLRRQGDAGPEIGKETREIKQTPCVRLHVTRRGHGAPTLAGPQANARKRGWEETSWPWLRQGCRHTGKQVCRWPEGGSRTKH